MKDFVNKIQEQLMLMCNTGKLFRAEITGEEIYRIYLNSFANGDDPVFRDPNSSEHNCNHCNNFIRRYGNIVAVDANNKIISLFDVDITGEYNSPAKAMSKAIRSSKIKDVFFETFDELNKLPYESCKKSNTKFRLGVDKNPKRYTKEEAAKFGVVKPDQIIIFDHFYLDMPAAFVDANGNSVESIMGNYREANNVFLRGMEEIPLDTLVLVKDLIVQGSLLDGTTHLHKVEKMIPLKKQYDELAKGEKDNWCWVNSYKMQFAKFRNELIGVLCTELAQGEELNKACQSWNKRVDPANYMKASAPITKKQIAEAEKFVEENGYTESFDRRCAVLDDIRASEIKHMNVGNGTIKKVSLFDGVKSTSTRHKRSEFDGVEEVSIDKFMKDILPTCTSVEAFLKNTHEQNLVTLTTANNPDSKPIFKWSNNYSWTFNGNLAGKSQIKEAVKTQGGKVDGVLRFSIMWAEDAVDNSDLDAHCKEPGGNEIYYGNRLSYISRGNLDIDITMPQNHKSMNKLDVVENITFPELKRMTDGTYKFFVHQFSARGSKGFKAEIEFDGEIYSYEYNKPVSGNVAVADVTLSKGLFSIDHKLPESASSKTIYNLDTNEFHKVNLMCLSPNHWGENVVGNKHYFFMLEGCKTNQPIRSFHNENLIPALLEHRKVMEVLGATNMITPDAKQLSGLGFNSTVRDELIVRIQGSFKRVTKIKF
jgi:hypothetical protein